MVRARALITMLASLIALSCGLLVTPVYAQDAGGADPTADPAQQPAPQNTGGREFGAEDPQDTPTVPGSVAKIVDGIAYAPEDAPDAVKQVIWAANDIVGEPYLYGGGHNEDFVDDGYDCSGTVSYALHGGGLLARPRDSRSFFRFGAAGEGEWITIFTASSHAYMIVAGIRLDTSAAGDPSGGKGPQWRPLRRSNGGYKRRHPVAL